jgi:hypothetical protein
MPLFAARPPGSQPRVADVRGCDVPTLSSRRGSTECKSASVHRRSFAARARALSQPDLPRSRSGFYCLGWGRKPGALGWRAVDSRSGGDHRPLAGIFRRRSRGITRCSSMSNPLCVRNGQRVLGRLGFRSKVVTGREANFFPARVGNSTFFSSSPQLWRTHWRHCARSSLRGKWIIAAHRCCSPCTDTNRTCSPIGPCIPPKPLR